MDDTVIQQGLSTGDGMGDYFARGDEPRIIQLDVITCNDIDEILGLWHPHNLEFDKQRYNDLKKKYIQSFESPINILLDYLTPQNKEPRPIRSILSLIKNYRGFCVLEYPYMDAEFWDSYIGFYSGSFTPIDRECERLHFFQGEETYAEEFIKHLRMGATNADVKHLNLEYLGYCVLRPTKSHVIGRTAIKFDDKFLSNGQPILTAKQKCVTSIMGMHYEIETPEFIQQDPQLGQCATASLWVTSTIAAKRFGSKQITFSAITKQAVGGKLPNIPAAYAAVNPDSGLTPTEIKSALAASGMLYLYATEKVGGIVGTNLETCIRLGHFVYSFVESGLPVILCLDLPNQPIGHAVAAVGHFLPSNVDCKVFKPISSATGNPFHDRHFLVSSAINEYYAHDDCYGPFNKVTFKIPEEKNPQKKCLCQRWNYRNMVPELSPPPQGLQVELGRIDEDNITYRLKEAIVPVYFRIHNDSWDSLLATIESFEVAFEELDFQNKNELVFLWRSFLVTGSDFKRSICEKRKYTPKLLQFYTSLHLPKFIWVHEFSFAKKDTLNNCFPTPGEMRNIAGEFLVDSTSPKNDIKIISARIGQTYWIPPYGEFNHDYDAKPFPCFKRI
jgi:hypothetical protein